MRSVIFSFTLLFVFSVAYAADLSGQASMLEDRLVGFKIGSTTATLEDLYPKLYKHRLVMGEVLYEACNQDELIVFSFTEEAWSLSRITYISVRREEDISVCRDADGSLPDLGIEPSTPRGVRIGDLKSTVLENYGSPSEEGVGSNGITYLRYKPEQGKPEYLVENMTLTFGLVSDQIVSFSLSGDMPGGKKPF